MRRVLIFLLLGAMGFAQRGVPTAPTTNPPGSAGSANNNDSRDMGNEHPLELKSIDQVLHENPKLTTSLKAILPEDMTPQQACDGFKTLEQCVITIHTAQNLKLNFSDLKSKTTGKKSIKLEKAIEGMSAQANVKEEIKKAKKQASEDMKGVSLFGAYFPPRSRYGEAPVAS